MQTYRITLEITVEADNKPDAEDKIGCVLDGVLDYRITRNLNITASNPHKPPAPAFPGHPKE